MLYLRTFGGLSIEANGAPLTGAAAQRKTLALLAILAAAGRRGISRDKLIAYLWPDSDAERGRSLLKQACYALRRDLHEHDLILGTIELRLNPDVITSDVGDFEDALARAEPARGVTLYAGPFLDGFYVSDSGEFERWMDAERTRLKQRAGEVLEGLATAAAARGEHTVAADHWRRRAALDPLNSRVAVGLMTALAAAGDRAGALQYARVHETLLREELDAAPDPAVVALTARLREEPVAPAPSVPPVASQVKPAETAARAPAGTLRSAGLARGGEPDTSSLPAYLLYLRGQHYLGRRTEPGLRRAIRCFELAIDNDPHYAPAFVGLANAYLAFDPEEYGGPPATETFPAAATAARQALALEATLTEARVILGRVALLYDWDRSSAEREFVAALAASPAAATAHHWYAVSLMAAGAWDASVAELRRALELDPLSPLVPTDLGRAYYFARRLEDAIKHLRHTLEIQPAFPPALFHLGLAYAVSGRFDEANAVVREAASAGGNSPRPLLLQAYIAARAGGAQEARSALRAAEERAPERHVSPYYVAGVHAGLNDPEHALDFLTRAVAERSGDLIFAAVDPVFESLGPHPRFQQLLRSVGTRS